MLASLLAVLFAPGVASAATATYSSMAPKAGSRSLVSTPTITVTVSAPKGVKGASNCSLYVDGSKVKPSITYLATKYRKLRLTYRRTKPLAPGLHKVTVKIRDLKRHTSSRSWTFTVLAPPAPPRDMQATIESNACATCHVDYPNRHPMTACASCHGPSRPVPGVAFTPASLSAHTPSCAATACHRPDTAVFPHVLSSDCASCHDGRYATIPEQHGAATDEDHRSTSTQCTLSGCHDPSLTVEHLRHTVGGAAFTCETCHTSTDPAVIAALAARSTECRGCHADLGAHGGAATAHALPASSCLSGVGCHTATDAAALHGGACADCHGAGRTPSKDCAKCHAAEPHPNLIARHTAAPLGCTVAGCHPADVMTIHTTGAGAPGCGACHGAGKPALTLACGTSGCHPAVAGAHASHPVTLTAESISIAGVAYGSHACAECHALDLIALHGAKCATCHGVAALSATMGGGCAQTGCHAAKTARAQHASIDAAHALKVVPTCVMTGCHGGGSNVAAIHAQHGGCAACHKADVVPTATCAASGCHSSADAHPVANPHPTMTTGHTTGLPATCVKPGCHAADLAILHAAARGCATCHRDGATPTGDCATAGCHAPDVTAVALHPTYASGHVTTTAGCSASGCHPTNVITIHSAGAGAPGCGACHASGKPALTLSCGTVGCHPAASTAHASHPITLAAGSIAIAGVSFGSHACSECHALDLIALHGGKCATCHGGAPLSATLGGGCAQTGCHTAGTTLAQHARIDAAHTLASATTCVMTGCHSGGLNVAALHAQHGGCAACHKAGATLTLTCATTGCHSSTDAHPVSRPHPNMLADHSTGLPATCVKPGCHLAELAVLHSAAKACATCHGPGATPTANCMATGCHGSDVTAPALHPTYATGHVTAAVGCTVTGCHPTNVIAIHSAGTGAPGCGACHATGKPPLTLSCGATGCHEGQQAGHTSHPVTPSSEPVAISGVAFGTHACSECHALDLVALHAARCSTCHTTTGVTPTFAGDCAQAGCHASGALKEHGSIDADHVADTSACTSGTGCHSGGTNIAALHRTEGCATCHGVGRTPTAQCAAPGCHGAGSTHPLAAPHPTMAASHTTGLSGSCVKSGCHGADLPALHAAKGGCATCHWAAKPASATCVQSGCHAPDVSAEHASHPATVAPQAIRINGLNLGTFACTTCHASMDLQTIHANVNGCATCHPAAATAVATWDGGCTQSACHGPGSAHPMHANASTAHTLSAQPKCTSGTACHQGNSNVGGRDFALMHFGTAKGCANCHAPGVTKPADCAGCHAQWATGDHQSDHRACNDCHAVYKWDPATSTANKGAQNVLGDSSAPHWDLFDAEWTLRIGRAVIRQGYPYGDYTMLRFPPALGTPGPYSSTYMERTVTYTCSACHTGAGKTWVHPAYDHFMCGSTGDCHAHHYNWDPAQGSDSYVHNTPPAGWIATMTW